MANHSFYFDFKADSKDSKIFLNEPRSIPPENVLAIDENPVITDEPSCSSDHPKSQKPDLFDPTISIEHQSLSILEDKEFIRASSVIKGYADH